MGTVQKNSYGGHGLILQSTKWRDGDKVNISCSVAPYPIHIHEIRDKGLPSLSLHALLAQLDINTLMPASSQSTLSLKKGWAQSKDWSFRTLHWQNLLPSPSVKRVCFSSQKNACVAHATRGLEWFLLLLWKFSHDHFPAVESPEV